MSGGKGKAVVFLRGNNRAQVWVWSEFNVRSPQRAAQAAATHTKQRARQGKGVSGTQHMHARRQVPRLGGEWHHGPPINLNENGEK